jgi:hypothetical protein
MSVDDVVAWTRTLQPRLVPVDPRKTRVHLRVELRVHERGVAALLREGFVGRAAHVVEPPVHPIEPCVDRIELCVDRGDHPERGAVERAAAGTFRPGLSSARADSP